MTHTNTPTTHTQGVTHSLALPHKTLDEVVGSLWAPQGLCTACPPPRSLFLCPSPLIFLSWLHHKLL